MKTNVFGVEITYETQADLDKQIADLRRKHQLAYSNIIREKKTDEDVATVEVVKIEPEVVVPVTVEAPKVDVVVETKVEVTEEKTISETPAVLEDAKDGSKPSEAEKVEDKPAPAPSKKSK